MIITYNDNYLMHYQVKGAKHGVRRYQNEDGSLTPLGRIHYGVGQERSEKEQKKYDRRKNEIGIRYGNSHMSNVATKRANKARIKADTIKNKYGEDSDKYRKADKKAVKKEAAAKSLDALRSKMKEMELQNLEDGSYQSNYRKNLGKQLGAIALADIAGVSLVATTGFGFGVIPISGQTSLTRDQRERAEKYAKDVEESYIKDHSNSSENRSSATAKSGADFDGDTASVYGTSRSRNIQNKDGSLTPEGRIHYEKGRGPKSATDNPSKRADDYIKKNNLENAKAIEATTENIHKENFRTSQTDEYRSKFASLRNKGDKKLERLIEASQKAEDDYLDIAEDDFRVHDDSYRNEQAKADLAHKLASQELIRYVMSQK